MEPVAVRLVHMAAKSRGFLEGASRREVARFILGHQNRDGGFRGRDAQSDLYYSLFAVSALSALGWRPYVFRLWRYVYSFGTGQDLDLIHLVCLIRLRKLYPMLGRTRRGLLKAFENHDPGTAYDPFVRLLAADVFTEAHVPVQPPEVTAQSPTTNIAAAMVVNSRPDADMQRLLMERACPTGGFAPGARIDSPDLLSTATALFALASESADLEQIRKPCLEYVESLWRDSGGFAGHEADAFEDVEYTFYGLLSIGCLMA